MQILHYDNEVVHIHEDRREKHDANIYKIHWEHYQSVFAKETRGNEFDNF